MPESRQGNLFCAAGAADIGVRFQHQSGKTLLSDADSMVRKRYGVPTAFGLPGRVTYIIDRQGMVHHIFFSQFTAEKHVAQALSTLQSIREEDI